MPGTRTEATLVWVCSCCISSLVNDDRSGCEEFCDTPPHRDSAFYVDHNPDAPKHHTLLLTLFPDDADLTAGMLWDEHDETCANRLAGEWVEECSCETITFSSSACAGCGGLPGERHAVTIWTQPEEKSA